MSRGAAGEGGEASSTSRASGVMGGTIAWTDRTRKSVFGGTNEFALNDRTKEIVSVHHTAVNSLMLGPKKKNQSFLALSGKFRSARKSSFQALVPDTFSPKVVHESRV